MLNLENNRALYSRYFKEFHRLAVDTELSYGQDIPNGTSSSLESIIAYVNYIIRTTGEKPKILNAGAGASSWMFRNIYPHEFITCIDPNKKYLDLVKKVCGGDRYFQGFDTIRNERFDHIYWDYGNIERLPYLGYAIDMAKSSVYVDDVDNRSCAVPYRDTVIRLCQAMNLRWFDCTEAKDEYERWGIIIEK